MVGQYFRWRKENEDIHLLGSLVKHLALCRQCVWTVDEIIELFASLEDRLDGLVLLTWRISAQQWVEMDETMNCRCQVRPVLTKMILVSSNSCCTLMMVSAWVGSWYFDTYVWISGKLMEEGLLYDDWGILEVNSSRILVRRENAGRTGYSWSVIMTAE